MRVTIQGPGPRPRRGVVMVCVLVCLMVIALMAGALIRLGLARRESIRADERRWQAEWLAQAGLERAAARLAADPGYEGETWEPSAEDMMGPWGGRVVIEVERADDGRAGRPVRVRADYPRDATLRARRTVRATIDLGSEGAGGSR